MVSGGWGRSHCKHYLVGGLQTVLKYWGGPDPLGGPNQDPPRTLLGSGVGLRTPKRLCRGPSGGGYLGLTCRLPPMEGIHITQRKQLILERVHIAHIRQGMGFTRGYIWDVNIVQSAVDLVRMHVYQSNGNSNIRKEMPAHAWHIYIRMKKP